MSSTSAMTSNYRSKTLNTRIYTRRRIYLPWKYNKFEIGWQREGTESPLELGCPKKYPVKNC